jgi:hypothetical protein
VTAKLAPVDAVITWVDGSDPKHAQKLSDCLRQQGIERPSTVSQSRLNDSGELAWCVTSIFRFAPWIRTIFIVSDEQTPSLIKVLANTPYQDRVKIVDHTEIFRGHLSVLPIFNIRSLTTALWRIEGLSDRFIFFNDDFFLLRPVEKRDFFRDGTLVVRGRDTQFKHLSSWGRFLSKLKEILSKRKSSRASHLLGQEKAAKLAGMNKRYLRLDHNPHPCLRHAVADFYSAHPKLFEENIRYRFRSEKQFVGEALATYVSMLGSNAIVDNTLKTVQIKPADQSVLRIKQQIQAADESERYAIACVQGLDTGTEEIQSIVKAWIHRRVGTLEQFLLSLDTNNKRAGDAPSS